MKQEWITGTVSVLVAIIGIAIIAVIVSPRARTAGVFRALGDAISQLICVATKPVTGADCGTSISTSINYGEVIPQFGGGPV